MGISIIVPVYNVADYLPACMDSLLANDLTDCEIILVDDGSTDGRSPGLCDEYAARHPALVRVIHQANGGLGAARNRGIEAARGEYLLFVDSDDTLAPQSLALLSAAAEGGAEMIVFQFSYVTDTGEIPGEPSQYRGGQGLTSLAQAPELLLDSPSACFRLWKRELLADKTIRFPGRVWYEDLCTTPKALLRAGSIQVLPDRLYRYRLRPGSIMRNDSLKRNLEILNALETVRVDFEAQGALEQYKPWLSCLAVDSVLAAARRVLMQDPKAPYLPEFLGYVRAHYPDYRANALLPRLGRKKLILLRLLEGEHYGLARRIFLLANKLKSD